ncbi:MAG: DNA primase [Ignavibacteria bacterium]|nr:MAG: DNA primase [Ignavibacteria bacterium]
MRISQDKIQEIKNAVSIVDVISGYVQLKKTGNNYKGLCPFHQEKTPSFVVSEEKQIFHCFGCHEGGTVFQFLMGIKKISFPEAVKEVAEYAGITIQYEEGYDPSVKDEMEILYEINVLAAKFFAEKLYQSIEGQSARDYLEERKIKLQTQRNFGLGYAPDSWSALKNYLEEQKVDLDKAGELGLLDKKEQGTYYDKFRDRIIYPIFSTNGRVIAFGGRILNPNAKGAKYLNSPESKLYSKRKVLYGLYQSKEEIRKLDKAILVEGYMDVIALFQAGVKNVVASSGTALTDDQVKLLSRFTKNIVVLFDADTAGQNAALRSIEILLKNNFEIQVLTLPEGEDPDSFIQKFGKDEFEERMKRADNFLEYQMKEFGRRGLLDDPASQTESVRALVRNIAFIEDELKRELHIRNIAKKFNLREKLLESELDKFLSENAKKKSFAAEREARTMQKPEALPQTNDEFKIYKNGLGKKFEREVIELLFEGNEEIIGYIFDHIQPDEFIDDNYRLIATKVYELYRKDIIQPSDLIDALEDESLKDFVRSITLSEEVISKKWDELNPDGGIKKDIMKYTIDLVKRYRIARIDELIKETNLKLANANEEEVIELLDYIRELQSEKKLINEAEEL